MMILLVGCITALRRSLLVLYYEIEDESVGWLSYGFKEEVVVVVLRRLKRSG
jgi:hypothetical protein